MILVVGPTGLVGGMIARRLLSEGQSVRILVRPTADYKGLVAAGAGPVAGDLKAPASLRAACSGVDVVVTTATSGSRGGDDTADSVDLHGNRELIDAASAAGVQQFVFVSTIAADEASPIPLLRAKALSEAYLRQSGVTYTILASHTLLDVLVPLVVGRPAELGRPVTLIGEGRRLHSFVAAQDVAAFGAATVWHPEATNRRILIGGPRPVSWRDVVSTYERELGRHIPIRSISAGELLPDLPAVPGLAEVVSSMVAALGSFDFPIEMTETAATFGVELTSLEQFVHSGVGVPA